MQAIKASYKGKLSDPKSLLAYLNLKEEAFSLCDNIYVYANLKADLDNADNEASEMASTSQSVSTNLYVAVSFEAPEL